MKKKMLLRQGDVLLEQVKELPKGLKKKESKLIARGEFSNHAHFAVGEVAVMEAENGDMYLNVDGDSTLEHLLEDSQVWTGEHTPVELGKGFYKVILQREYDPYEETIKRVQD
jgi:hypothetical protein